MSSALCPLGLQIRVGQVIDLNGKRYFLLGRVKDASRAMIWQDENGETIRLDDAEFLRAQQARELCIVTEAQLQAAAAKEAMAGRPPVTMDSLLRETSELSVAEILRRRAYVTAWESAGRPNRVTKNIEALIDTTSVAIADPAPPRPRTVLAWLSKFIRWGNDAAALVPQVQNRGNRVDKLSAKARQLVGDAVDRYYLTDQRLTAVSVHRHVESAFADYNKTVSADERLECPSENATRRHIARIDKFIADCCRYGKRHAEHKYRQIGSGPETEIHNQRWEVDHTTADVLVIDDDTKCVIGRPTVTVIIDRHTRMAVGYHLSFDGPCADSVIEALAMAISPKESLLRKYPNIRGVWPCFGVPRTIVCDNASEFRSATFIEICLRLGMDVMYAPVLKAWYKGTIERFIRTLSVDVFHRVPGTTFANFYHRNGENPPEKTAIVTLRELEGHLIHYLVDVYSVRVHRGIEKTPLTAWQESVAAKGILPPPDPERLARDLAAIEFRKPRRDGIEYMGNHYHGPELARLVAGVEPPDVVKVKVDRNDLTHMWFVDPQDNEPKEIEIVSSVKKRMLQGVSLSKFKLGRALQRNNPEEFGGDEGMVKAFVQLDQTMMELTGADGRADRRKAAAYRENLLKAKRPEEPGAFDLVESGQSVSDALFDDLFPEGMPVDISLTAADQAEPPSQKQPKRQQADRTVSSDNGAEPARQEQQPAFDPEEYLRRTGLNLNKDV